jgi:hypothetical protein
VDIRAGTAEDVGFLEAMLFEAFFSDELMDASAVP